MKRSRSIRIKKYVESSESEDDRPLIKKSPPNENHSPKQKHESSSESDIEDYLLKPGKLDLDSQFFNPSASGFEKVEKDIFSGITKLNDSESDTDEVDEEREEEKNVKPEKEKFATLPQTQSGTSKMNFKQLQDYTKQIEEAKRHIEIYKAKKEAEENQTDILNLLAAGERKTGMEQTLKPADLHSSDFESCDSEQEDWEEIKSKATQENQENNLLPKGDLQITVDMPVNVKKKKGVDLLAAMKRRLNRIRKENQVLVHKVHLLCWIAHGNYVNSSINDTETLARALSLLPSEQCYPSNRVDLTYLEQIVNWYKRTIKNIEKPAPESISLDKCLQSQIGQKEAYNKKMLVYIFIGVLRALGVQTRVVISLQVEPLRPPQSDLHTVSTKVNEKKSSTQTAVNTKTSCKVSADKQSKAQKTISKHIEPKLSMPVKEPNKNKALDISSKLKLKVDKANKLSVKKSTTERDKKIESKATRSQNEEKAPDIKTQGRKSTRLRNSQGDNKKGNLKGDETKQLSNKDDKLESSKPQSETVKLPLHNNTGSKMKDPSYTDNSKTTTSSKKSKSVKSDENSGNSNEPGNSRKSKSKSSERTSQNQEQSKNKQKTNTRSKSTTESKDAARSKNIEHGSDRRLQPKTKKRIPQVDGIDDSDSDTEAIILQLDGANDNKKQSKSNNSEKASSSHTVKKSSKKARESDSESEFEPSPVKRKRVDHAREKCNLKKLSSPVKQLDVRNDIVNLVKGRINEQKQKDRGRLIKNRKQDIGDDSDSDYVPETIKKKFHDSGDDFAPKTKVKRRVQPRSVLSDNENDEQIRKKGNDVWLEVFLEAEEKWISVDVIYGQVHCVKEIYQRASHPVSYVVSWDNNNKLKDVTQRYCQNFNTVTRKQRIDAKWWNDSIKPFMGIISARDREEDDDLARQQLDQPLPKAISEYKNHPLYALKRHLLKFEAIYPPEPPTLGFIRGEAVYPRGCIYTLHSRDIWLKQAKVVKLGEQPYKIVKARPKYDRLSNKMITDQLLEIFGSWQVQDYEPPTAENGIVPTNAFGNVDLFKPCMLPKGCVHLKLPGLNKIARRMNIDVATAIVGFDFHGGWSHPVYDGFVACKEYEDQLICAWELEQDEIERKEEEKIEKRVYGNWKKLIKGLLIRERLKAKYDFGEPSTSNVKDKKTKPKRSTK